MSNRTSTIERLNRNYGNLLGRQLVQQSVLKEEGRVPSPLPAVSGRAGPVLIPPGSRVVQTFTTNQPIPVMNTTPNNSTLPTRSIVEVGSLPSNSIQTN